MKKIKIFLILGAWLLIPKNTYAQSTNLTISVTVGEQISKLYGYTSPEAEVSLITDPNVIENTQSDSTGYFEFANFYISSRTSEMCLEAVDRNSRTTNPVCIPSPSQEDSNVSIGPVILPPSLTINNGYFIVNQTVAATGESLPDSEVRVSFFSEDKLNLIPKTYAFALPAYTIKTDSKGYYSLNLPSSASNTFRIFSQAIFSNQPSPKSNTLTFKVFSPFWKLIIFLIIIFIIALALIGWFRKHRKKSIMVVNNYPSVIDYQLENIPPHIVSKLVKRDSDRLR
ncbi:hypothetical protein HYT02_06125 [Candidatus Gottesmanbacteria bacterium]|nr:hypothetical protein [Candidatus Gottesmanbacteria bacterium]